MMFVMGDTSNSLLEQDTRSGANLLFFVQVLAMLRHFKIKFHIELEGILAPTKQCANFSNVPLDDNLADKLEEELQRRLEEIGLDTECGADLQQYCSKHRPRKGCFFVGLRALVVLERQDVNLALLLREWFHDAVLPGFDSYTNGLLPNRVRRLTNSRTFARHLAIAMGDRTNACSEASDLMRNVDDYENGTHSQEPSFSALRFFRPRQQIEQTWDILWDAHNQKEAMIAACRQANPTCTDPAAYGTLFGNMNGEYAQNANNSVYTSDEDDAMGDDTGDADGTGRPAAVTGGVVNGKEVKRTHKILGFPREPPSTVFSQDNLALRQGTVVQPEGTFWIYLRFSAAHVILKTKIPFQFTIGEIIQLTLVNDSEFRRSNLAIYDDQTPLFQQEREQSVSPNSANLSVESTARHSRRHTIFRETENLAFADSSHAAGPSRKRPREEPGDDMSDEDRLVPWIAGRMAHAQDYLDKYSPWRETDELTPTALEHRSKIKDAVVNSFLYKLLQCMYNKDGRHCKFHWAWLEFGKRKCTVQEFANWKVMGTHKVDGYNMGLDTMVLFGMMENMDMISTLGDTHDTWWILRSIAAALANLPGKSNKRQYGGQNAELKGKPGSGKTYAAEWVKKTMIPGTFGEPVHKSLHADHTAGVGPNGTPSDENQYITEFFDEGGAQLLGQRERAGRHIDPIHEKNMCMQKQKLGEQMSQEVKRCHINDNGRAETIGIRCYFHGATIICSNAQYLPNEAMSDRILSLSRNGGLNDVSAVQRGDMTVSQIVKLADKSKMSPVYIEDVCDNYWRVAHWMHYLEATLEAAGLLSWAAAKRMHEAIISNTMDGLKERLGNRQTVRLQGLAHANQKMLVAHGLLQESARASICQAANIGTQPDANQPFAVAKWVADCMRVATAPCPTPALMAMGMTIGKEHSKCVDDLIIVWCAALCGVRHFDYDGLVEQVARAHPILENDDEAARTIKERLRTEELYAKLDDIAKVASYPRTAEWKKGVSAPGDDIDFNQLDTKMDIEELVSSLAGKGLCTQEISSSLERLSTTIVQLPERNGSTAHQGSAYNASTGLFSSITKQGVWHTPKEASMRSAPVVRIRALDPVTRKYVVHINAGFAFATIAALHLPPNVREKLGPDGKQKLPKTFQELGLHEAKKVKYRTAVAKRGMPGGLPVGACYVDGTTVITNEMDVEDDLADSGDEDSPAPRITIPGICMPQYWNVLCVDSVCQRTTQTEPQDTEDVRDTGGDRYKLDCTRLSLATGRTRYERMGDCDDDERDKDERERFLGKRIEREGFRGQNAQMLNNLDAFLDNGVLHMLVRDGNEDQSPKLTLPFPNPAANVHTVHARDEIQACEDNKFAQFSYPEGYTASAIGEDRFTSICGNGCSFTDRKKVAKYRNLMLGDDELVLVPQVTTLQEPTNASTPALDHSSSASDSDNEF